MSFVGPMWQSPHIRIVIVYAPTASSDRSPYSRHVDKVDTTTTTDWKQSMCGDVCLRSLGSTLFPTCQVRVVRFYQSCPLLLFCPTPPPHASLRGKGREPSEVKWPHTTQLGYLWDGLYDFFTLCWKGSRQKGLERERKKEKRRNNEEGREGNRIGQF